MYEGPWELGRNLSAAGNRSLEPNIMSLCCINSRSYTSFKYLKTMVAVRRLVHGYPRSSILGLIESPYATSYQSLIVTLDVSPTVFKIMKHKARKYHVWPTAPLFDADAPARGIASEFLDETYPAKTIEGCGYCRPVSRA